MRASTMHADEMDHDVPLVRRLVAAQFPRWADLPVEPFDSSGTDNAIYRLGGDMAVRLPRRPGSAAQVEKDLRWLPRLAPLLPVPIPVPLGEGEPAEGYPLPWSVYRWLDGENPSADRLTEPSLLAKDLAEFVAAFRRIDLPDGPPAYRGGPLSMLDAPTRAAIDELRGVVDTDAAAAAWETALKAPGWAGPPVWIHSDLMPGNLLVVQGRLSAVIDFGTVGVGDPACDLIVAWNLLPAGVRNDFRTVLQIDDATWARGRGRALSIALIALPYYKDTNPVFAANARHVIHEVLADHENAA
ncbi:aminoglycoside phosphotransferase (APT) family kinase protein [Streptosporangium album]|uniref:Aminoglycoside phosphotransferase (APT) family kinase protein n=1 Tax=Streptosporangium album TaxID=47479 RepID=A0A7W7W9B7_9ACTN|nr:aminoglycoside phosphotransferase family protein [Streptosporangium album]MBB4939237.1 aminoglycoside phosphotransferase (APT) family kinase protein [Streptosporangium album]